MLGHYSEKRNDSIWTDVKEIVPTNMLASLVSIFMLTSVLFMFVFLGSTTQLATPGDLSIETSAANSPRSSNSSSTTNTSQATNSEGEDFVYVEKVIEKK